MPEQTIPILGQTYPQFAEAAADHGLSAAAARQHYRRTFRDGRPTRDWIRLPDMPVLRTEIDGETIKFAQQLCDQDGRLETESVLIPMRQRRTGRTTRTLCVSSQIGCAMGCEFCETAQMGLMANLAADQIIGQWHAARFHFGETVKNIVFMGMGEPLDNIDAVIQAIRVFADHNGPAIAPANISVSTVGRGPAIRQLSGFVRETGFRRVNLAVSVNAPNDEIRSSIMPVNRATPMADLMDALLEWPKRPAAPICVEYVLIPGVNDALEHADELCDYVRPLNCTVNVIPYNPRRDSPWPAPDEASVERFTDRIRNRGQFVKRRTTKGRSAMAACGQLGNPAIRRRQFVEVSTTVSV